MNSFHCPYYGSKSLFLVFQILTPSKQKIIDKQSVKSHERIFIKEQQIYK